MKKIILLLVISSLCFISCSKDDPKPVPKETEHTLLMYLPWSTNLTSYFRQNIADFEKAITGDILTNNRLIVFFSSSATEAEMFELKYEKGKNIRTLLKEYDDLALTTSEGITSILSDVKAFAPAKRYSMTVGCHGMGWLPVPAETPEAFRIDSEKYHYEYEGIPLTRYFGGLTSKYQTDISTLAEGIAGAGLMMEYILFDDCYMSSIEVAYDLKDVTRCLIASPTEVMAYGFPYHLIGKHLLNNNYRGICEGFYNFYANYYNPYGTIALIDCMEVDDLASIMRLINQNYVFDQAKLEGLQRMDGYTPVIFFDVMHYVENLCPPNTELLTRFRDQLTRTVPPEYRLHTPSYYSARRGVVEIREYSGATISDPSVNPKSVMTKTETAWYRATH